MALKKEEVNVVVSKFGKNAADTGNTSVQIALLTKRITDLTEHLKHNGQDTTARRSLMALVGKRRNLLDYLARHDGEEYAHVIETIGLRK